MKTYPAHECVDRPHLPCPACTRASKVFWGRVRLVAGLVILSTFFLVLESAFLGGK